MVCKGEVMPTFEFTSPDGKTYEIQGPEGATKEQAFGILQKQIASQPKEEKQQKPSKPEPTFAENLKAVPGDFLERLQKGNSPVASALGAGGNLMFKNLSHAGNLAGEAVLESDVLKSTPPEVRAGAATAANMLVSSGPGIGGGAKAGATLAGKVAGSVEGKLGGVAEGVMQSALKPILSQLKHGDAATAIRTMLNEGVNVTPGGMRKLRGMIDGLNNEIKQKLANSTATINKAKVASYLGDLLDRVKQQVNPQADMQAVRNAFQQFWEHPTVGRHLGKDMTVQEAQALKQGTYRELGSKAYGELKGADTEAQKTLARGLKEEIATAVPEIAGLNKRESELINALNVAERRVLISANKNPAGLSILAGNPKAMAAFMADRSELFKSLAARMINASAKKTGQLAGGAVGGGVAGAIPLKQHFDETANR
jgi:hypothetical protein